MSERGWFRSVEVSIINFAIKLWLAPLYNGIGTLSLPRNNNKGEEMIPTKNIVETAVAAGSFNTLVAAVTAAGLVDLLSGPGPFTVFAPTDEAFKKIPKETLDALLADKDQLTKILTYHVVPGKVMASQVVTMKSATTAQGQDVDIDSTDGVKINMSKVVTADVDTSNGVIHAIDTVLMPQ